MNRKTYLGRLSSLPLRRKINNYLLIYNTTIKTPTIIAVNQRANELNSHHHGNNYYHSSILKSKNKYDDLQKPEEFKKAFSRKEVSTEEKVLNIQEIKKQIEQELERGRQLQQQIVDRNLLEKSKRELGKDVNLVRNLLVDKEFEKAGLLLMNRISTPGTSVLCNEMLTVSLLFVQSLLQGWAFNTSEWNNWIEKMKETEVSKLLNEMMQKNNPERFGLPEKYSEIQSNNLKKAVHSILTSNYSDLISKSSIIDLEIQKAFIFFFTNVIKDKINPNITPSKELFSGYCYSIMLNESLMNSENNAEKSVLLKMFNNAHTLFQNSHLDNYTFEDIGTGIPLNLKSCMNLCKIILNSDGKSEKAIEITKSQLFELQKTDPNNPYITYFGAITFEKRVKHLLTKDASKSQVKIEESLYQCLNMCNLLEKMLKRYSVKKSSSYSFLPIAFRIASTHSMYIDYYSKSRETLPKVQESAKIIIEQLDILQELFKTSPPRISNNLITQSIFLRIRANFYLRNHEATDEAFKTLFSIRHLCEFDPTIVNSASFYLAGRTVTKRTPEAIPYLQELESEHPESLDLKLLLINAKDFSLENSLVTKELIISIVENYRHLKAQVEKEKPKNTDALLHKIKTRLVFLENLLGQK